MAADDIRIEVELRWRDLDFLGHLNQAVYHELLEEGRGALFQRLGVIETGFFFVLARVELDHLPRDPARPQPGGDRPARRGRRALERHGRPRDRAPDGTVAARGSSVLVAWDRDARRSRPLTDDERAKLG